MNSASLCSLAGRYDNPIPPWFQAPTDFLKIPALDKNHTVVVAKLLWPDFQGSLIYKMPF
jgi:hypothetical protein